MFSFTHIFNIFNLTSILLILSIYKLFEITFLKKINKNEIKYQKVLNQGKKRINNIIFNKYDFMNKIDIILDDIYNNLENKNICDSIQLSVLNINKEEQEIFDIFLNTLENHYINKILYFLIKNKLLKNLYKIKNVEFILLLYVLKNSPKRKILNFSQIKKFKALKLNNS